MTKILAIPNTNAATERLFSLLRYVHTEQRNSLSHDTINCVLSIKVNQTSDLTKFDFGYAVKKKCEKATMLYNQAHSSATNK